MSLEVCVLGSGSSGNCTVVRRSEGCAANGVMLIDAGLGPRTTAKRMIGTGVGVGDVRAICLTHLDHDHFNGNWALTILQQGIRVFCHARKVGEVVKAMLQHGATGDVRDLVHAFDGREFQAIEGLAMRAIALDHDVEGSHGFMVDAGAARMGYATDLGRVTGELVEAFAGVDVLALESNYDKQMEMESERPWYLKQRIMGGAGHLSNAEALAGVVKILGQAQKRKLRMPAHIVLLHRSRQCNCPVLLRKLFEGDKRVAGRLTLAEQASRTGWLRVHAGAPLVGEQLVLNWG